ncbi:TPA: MipA/OmpV family protein [Serratia odorifera]|nr:MipA/OmpV family protein [Serratia odorifera]
MNALYRPLFGSRTPIPPHATATACYLLLCWSFSTLAQPATVEQESVWGLGVGVVSSQKAYKSIDRDTSVMPLLHVDNRYFHFFGTGLELKLPGLALSETQRLNFGLIGRYDGAGYHADDSPVLDGMAERKGGLWGGVRIEWQTALVNLHADWTHDVSGNSKGQQIALAADRSWRIGDSVTLTPRFGLTWHDDKYTDYYYGVRAEEARAGRPAYQGEAGIDVEIGMRAIYAFNPHHAVMFDVQATRLSTEIGDSPITERTTENRFFLGYAYYF